MLEAFQQQLEAASSRIDRLEKLLAKQANNQSPTLPIYDPTNFPQDAIEGQIVLGVDDTAYQYTNGSWHQIGIASTPYIPPTGMEVFTANGITVSVADQSFNPLIWTYDSGPTLLDLTVDDTPTIIDSGIYSISATALPVSNMNIGGGYQIWFNTTNIYFPEQSVVAWSEQLRPVISVSLTRYFNSGDWIQLILRNQNGPPDLDFTLRAIVQKIT